MEWTGQSIVVAAKDQVSCDLAGDTAILNLKSGIYYSLNRIGSTVWNLIQKPATLDEIRDAILDEYDVQSSRCENDLMALIEDLAAEGLIDVSTQTSR